MGREFLIPPIYVFFFAFSACEKSGAENKTPTAKTADAPSIPKDGVYDRAGEATKINPEPGSVELKHEDMPGFTPAMKMEFYVRDKAMLKDLKVGDRIRFALEYKNPTETITSISKAP
jgi:Cu/Ag efflux protein CusF